MRAEHRSNRSKKRYKKTQTEKTSHRQKISEKTEEMLSRRMITSEYREALEQFTLRYNELTGILRERKEKSRRQTRSKVQLQVQKQEDWSH